MSTQDQEESSREWAAQNVHAGALGSVATARTTAVADAHISKYENTVISGHASAHLGNKISTANVENLHIYLPGSLNAAAAQATPTIVLRDHNNGWSTKARQEGVHITGQCPGEQVNPQTLLGLVDVLDNTGLEEIFNVVTSTITQLLRDDERNKEVNSGVLKAIVRWIMKHTKQWYDELRTPLSLPERCFALYESTVCRPQPVKGSSKTATVTRLKTKSKPWRLIRIFLKYCALYVSYIVCRTASTTHLFAVLSRLQSLLSQIKDEKIASCFAVILTVFGLHLLHELSAPHALTEQSGDCIESQVPFGRDKSIPLVYLYGPNRFKGFLLDQYAGSNAQWFVENGHYSLNIGRRDGRALLDTDLNDDLGLIFSNMRLIMAICWRRSVTCCPDCKHQLEFSAGNWLECGYCRRSYQVRESSPLARTQNKFISGYTDPSVNITDGVVSQQPSAISTVSTLPHDLQDFSFGNLRNIDLDVEELHINGRSASTAGSAHEDSHGSDTSEAVEWEFDDFESMLKVSTVGTCDFELPPSRRTKLPSPYKLQIRPAPLFTDSIMGLGQKQVCYEAYTEIFERDRQVIFTEKYDRSYITSNIYPGLVMMPQLPYNKRSAFIKLDLVIRCRNAISRISDTGGMVRMRAFEFEVADLHGYQGVVFGKSPFFVLWKDFPQLGFKDFVDTFHLELSKLSRRGDPMHNSPVRIYEDYGGR